MNEKKGNWKRMNSRAEQPLQWGPLGFWGKTFSLLSIGRLLLSAGMMVMSSLAAVPAQAIRLTLIELFSSQLGVRRWIRIPTIDIRRWLSSNHRNRNRVWSGRSRIRVGRKGRFRMRTRMSLRLRMRGILRMLISIRIRVVLLISSSSSFFLLLTTSSNSIIERNTIESELIDRFERIRISNNFVFESLRKTSHSTVDKRTLFGPT